LGLPNIVALLLDMGIKIDAAVSKILKHPSIQIGTPKEIELNAGA
jgi:hypothetical protein